MHAWCGQLVLSALLALLSATAKVSSYCHAYNYNPEDCGMLDEVQTEDIRTQNPWTVAIFLRRDNDSLIFHTSGSILGPYTLITVLSGPIDKLLRKVRGRWSSPGDQRPSGDYLVAAGLKSGNIDDQDEFTQLAEVTFIEPYLGYEEQSRDHHFLLIHLKSPFDFSTPYVKAICLAHLQLGRRGNDASSILDYAHGGFAKRKSKKEGDEILWDIKHKLQIVQTRSGYDCVKSFERYYNKIFPIGFFCTKVLSAIGNDTSCFMQGSAVTQKIGHQWYLMGLTTFIRGRKGGMCKYETVYFNARLSATVIEWVERSLRCSPYSFSCSDGSCIPLESVCNSVQNCLDTNADENPTLCELNRKCEDNPSHSVYQCNILGTCITRDQMCDGYRDCDEGSDESPILCNKDSAQVSSRSSRALNRSQDEDENPHCPPLQESEGIQIEYINPNRNGIANCTYIPPGTFAISKCRPFYKSTYQHSRTEQQCGDNGKWSEQFKFQCEPDCGTLNQRTFAHGNKTTLPKRTLPWHVLLFAFDPNAKVIKLRCSATLIARQFLLTAAHCFDFPITIKSFKVIASGVSANFSENLDHEEPVMTEIDNVWIPDGFNPGSRDNDIALVKMKRPLRFGAHIRPACFLHEGLPEQDNSITSTLHAMDPRRPYVMAQAGIHIYDFPSVAETVCISSDLLTPRTLHLKCAGHDNGVPVKPQEMGGGLVSRSKTKFGYRYALQGIMSAYKEEVMELISQFTPVERYREWITYKMG